MELDFDTSYTDQKHYEEIYSSILEKTIKYFNIKANLIVSVSIISKELIHDLNKKYRHIDRPTDVISFAFLDGADRENILNKENDVVLGDIYICLDVAKEHSIEYKNTLDRELRFLFVHGLLHLLGYDHMSKEEEEVMFPLQEIILGL